MKILQKNYLFGFNNKQKTKSFDFSVEAIPGQKKNSQGNAKVISQSRINSKQNSKNTKFGNAKVISQSRIKSKQNSKNTKQSKSKVNVLSLVQLLAKSRKLRERKVRRQNRLAVVRPIIPPKAFVIVLTEKPKKIVYNRRIVDYKHCGLLQKYLGLGGKILPRRQTRLTAKQQRLLAKAIKSARVMGLLPFVSKERGFFR